MVRGRERVFAGQPHQFAVAGWPEHGGVKRRGGAVCQYVVDAQVPRCRVVVEVCGVERRVSLVVGIRSTLQFSGFCRTGRSGLGVEDELRVEQLVNGAVPRVAVERIRVVVTNDYEVLACVEAAGVAVVVVQVVGLLRGVVGPDADLVVVALLVALFLTVEGGRCGVCREYVHGGAVDVDRDVGVSL